MSNSDHETKSYSCLSFSTELWKNKRAVKISGLQNGVIRGLQIRAGFRDYKSGQKDYKSGQGFQIGSRGISIWGRDYQSGQGLQIGTEHSDCEFGELINFLIKDIVVIVVIDDSLREKMIREPNLTKGVAFEQSAEQI